MKKSKLLVLLVTLVLVATCVGCYFVFAADQVNIKITGNGDFTVSVNGNISQNGYDGSVDKNAEVTIKATGENFLYLMDDNKNTIKSEEYTFVAEFDTSYEVCFKPSSGSWVVYRNTNLTQQVIAASDPVAANSSFTEHLATEAIKYGYVFTDWSLTVEEIQSKITSGVSYIEVNPIYDALEGKYTVSVVNGTIDESVTEGAYSNNEKITLKVNDADAGKKFSHWIDAEGRIVSDKETFDVLVFKNDTFTAVYVDSAEEVVHTPGLWLDLYTADEIIYSRAQMFVPTGYTVEYGLLYAKGTTPANLKFELDDVGTNGIKKVSYTAVATVLSNHFTFEEDDRSPFVYVRAYMTYKKDGEVIDTIYSGESALYAESYAESNFDDTVDDSFGEFDTISGKKTANDYAYDSSATLVTYANRDETSFELACQNYILDGYSIYGQVNTLGEVKSATYVKGSALAHIYYSSLENELAIVTSATEGANLPAPIAFSGDKSKTSVTQMPGSAGNTSGMGYIIHLADGSFIVYDGGYTSETADIYNVLVKLNGSEEGIVIRAWVLTHGDGDHYQALQSFLTNYASKVKFEYLMTAPIKDSFNGSKSTGSNVATTETMAKNAGIKICRVHTGMVFNFCDVEMEILMAPESIFAYSNPSAHKAYTDSSYEFYGRGDTNGYQNETSIVSRIKASNNRKTFIVLGDAGHAVADKLIALYGNADQDSYLKSDICQVSHHSCETFSLEGYQAIDANIWFYPCNSSLYTNNSTEVSSGYTASGKGRNWYILQQLKTMGTQHIVRDTNDAKGSTLIDGDNHQSFNK